MTIYDSLDGWGQHTCLLCSASTEIKKWGRKHDEAKFGNLLENPIQKDKRLPLRAAYWLHFHLTLDIPQKGERSPPARALKYPTLPWLSAPIDGSLIAESARLHPKSITNFLKRKILQNSKTDFIQRRFKITTS